MRNKFWKFVFVFISASTIWTILFICPSFFIGIVLIQTSFIASQNTLLLLVLIGAAYFFARFLIRLNRKKG